MQLKKFSTDPQKNFNLLFDGIIDESKINNVEKRFLMLAKKKQQLKLPLSENEKRLFQD